MVRTSNRPVVTALAALASAAALLAGCGSSDNATEATSTAAGGGTKNAAGCGSTARSSAMASPAIGSMSSRAMRQPPPGI